MGPDDLLERVRQQPFSPLRLHVTGGATYDVRHPDHIIVLRSRAVLAAGERNGIPERLENIPLLQVLRIEELPVAADGGSN